MTRLTVLWCWNSEMTGRVAVIGAGPMGLGAAYELARQGMKPVVYEADSVIGGMAATFDFSGVDIERYYHFYCLSDHDLFEILRELGIETSLKWANTTMGYWYRDRVQRWGDPFALLRFRGLNPFSKLRYGIHVLLCTKRKRWLRLDGLDAKSWIRRRVGGRAFEVLWQNLFEYKFYDQSDNVSAAWIWSRIRRIGLSRETMFKEKLGYIDGGSQTLLDAMAEEIIRLGGSIELNCPVSRVNVISGSVVSVEVKGQTVPYDSVVSTVPLPYLSRIFPDIQSEYLGLIESKRNIAVVCVVAKLKRKVTDYFWMNTKDADMDIPGFVEFSNLRPCDDAIVYVPFYLPQEHPTYAESDEMFKDKVVRYLKKVNPDLMESDFLDFRVSRYQHAQPICEPGYLASLPPLDLGVRGVLAADTSYYYPEDRGLSESIGYGRKLARQIIAVEAS